MSVWRGSVIVCPDELQTLLPSGSSAKGGNQAFPLVLGCRQVNQEAAGIWKVRTYLSLHPILFLTRYLKIWETSLRDLGELTSLPRKLSQGTTPLPSCILPSQLHLCKIMSFIVVHCSIYIKVFPRRGWLKQAPCWRGRADSAP